MDGGQKQSNGTERKRTEADTKTDFKAEFVSQGEGGEGGWSRSHSLMTPTEGGRRIIIIIIIIIIRDLGTSTKVA